MSKSVYKRFASQRKFGVELEMGNEVSKNKVAAVIKECSERSVRVSSYALSKENDYWHVKEDSSCGPLGRVGPKGIEVASYICHGSNDINHVANVAMQLSQKGCRSNKFCGLHVHADATDISKVQLGILVAWWIKIEKVLSFAVPKRRVVNEHCRFLFAPFMQRGVYNGYEVFRDKRYDALDLLLIFEPLDLSHFDNACRRVNFNLVNMVRAMRNGSDVRKTLELRWPEGTLNSQDVRCWIRVFLGFIDTCKRFRIPHNLSHVSLEEMLSCLGLAAEKSAVLSPTLRECRIWLLERIAGADQKFLASLYTKSSVNKIVEDASRLLGKKNCK